MKYQIAKFADSQYAKAISLIVDNEMFRFESLLLKNKDCSNEKC
jgi:hypothetical protein